MVLKNRNQNQLNRWSNYLFIILPLIFLIVLLYIPFIRTIFYSFTNFNGFSEPMFIGLKNYIFLTEHTHFINAIKNNFIIALATPLWASIPLIIAVILFQNPGGLIKTARMTIMLPFALSMTISGILFQSLFYQAGPVNNLLTNLGLGFLAVNWLGEFKFAMPMIIGVAIWKDFGVLTIIYLAGLSTINKDVIDSAKIDGANWFQEFRHVIIPAINPIIVFVVAMILIGDFRSMFDYVYNITRGGPGFATETIEYLLYSEAFKFFNMGFACTLGVLIFFIISIITFLQIKIMTRND